MVSAATFHVVTTELVVGTFALAGLCFAFKLLSTFNILSNSKFDDALGINTCMFIDNELITYHCDILTALRCVTENREMRSYEWD